MINIQTSTNKIKKLYDKLSYFDQYGNSVIFFIILTMIILFINGYCNAASHSQEIKADWINQRCKPHVIPFAGYINKPEHRTAFEFTQDNFNFCTQQILIPITVDAVSPFTYIVSGLQSIFTLIANAIQEIRMMFNNIRNAFTEIMTEVMGRILNFLIPIQQLIIAAKDTMAKVTGVMTASLYTAMGSYLALKSLLGSMVQLFILCIIILIAVMLLTFPFIPFLLPLTIAIESLVMVTSITLILIMITLTSVGINASGNIPGVPSIPSCFDKNVNIQMENGSYKSIMNIQNGEKLYRGETVTSILKLDASKTQMYNLYGTIVSGCHSVKYNNSWFKVKQHPDSKIIEKYNEPFIYCINTTNKLIIINDIIYIDWDEMYDYIDTNIGDINNNIYLTKNLANVHKYFDSGFIGKTQITLHNNQIIDLKDVKVNDILLHGEKVYGIIEIDGKTVNNQYLYNYNGFEFIGGNNLNTCEININLVEKKNIKNKEDVLYHLLTDKNTFYIGEIKVHDYNYAIDSFLEKKYNL